MVTLKKINSLIDQRYELVRGEGYFYIWPRNSDTPELYDSSINVYRLNHMSLELWLETIADMIENGEKI